MFRRITPILLDDFINEESEKPSNYNKKLEEESVKTRDNIPSRNINCELNLFRKFGYLKYLD